MGLMTPSEVLDVAVSCQDASAQGDAATQHDVAWQCGRMGFWNATQVVAGLTDDMRARRLQPDGPLPSSLRAAAVVVYGEETPLPASVADLSADVAWWDAYVGNAAAPTKVTTSSATTFAEATYNRASLSFHVGTADTGCGLFTGCHDSSLDVPMPSPPPPSPPSPPVPPSSPPSPPLPPLAPPTSGGGSGGGGGGTEVAIVVVVVLVMVIAPLVYWLVLSRVLRYQTVKFRGRSRTLPGTSVLQRGEARLVVSLPITKARVIVARQPKVAPWKQAQMEPEGKRAQKDLAGKPADESTQAWATAGAKTGTTLRDGPTAAKQQPVQLGSNKTGTSATRGLEHGALEQMVVEDLKESPAPVVAATQLQARERGRKARAKHGAKANGGPIKQV